MEGRGEGLSPNKDSLLHSTKVFNCKKKCQRSSPPCLVQVIEHSMFQKGRIYIGKGEGLSPNKDGLLHSTIVFTYKKKRSEK